MSVSTFIVIFFIICLIIYFIFRNRWKTPNKPISSKEKSILLENVSFYNALTYRAKKRFEFKVSEFILNYKFTGNNTKVTEKDKVLIAASAIIPIFSFPNWRYNSLTEIIIFPDNFNRNFLTNQPDSIIRGLVGFGFLKGKLLVSRKALHQGYAINNDRRNTCIHEFIHLIDMQDGTVDGVPKVLLENKYIIPWIYLIQNEIIRINKNYSDIHPYATTNSGEFLAVISEYFFERPKYFKREHPQLFNIMNEIFKPDSTLYNQQETIKNT